MRSTTRCLSVETYVSAQDFLDAFDRSKNGLPSARSFACLASAASSCWNGFGMRALGIPVIMLTAYGDVATAVRALKNGAFEFLEKPVRAAALIEVVSKAITVHAHRREWESRRKSLLGHVAELSRREREVLDLLMRGKTVKQIAQELQVDAKTVHTHRAHVLEKLGASSNAELVLMFTSNLDAADSHPPATPPLD